MTGLLIYFVLGLVTGAIARNMARKRGRSGWWFFAGFFFSLLGCLLVGLIGRTQENIDAMHNRSRA